MEKSNKIGSLPEDPSDYFLNIDYTIKTKKIERKIEKIAWYEKIDLIIDISDTEPILLTNTENDDKEALEELLRYLYRKGYRRYK